MGIRKYLAPIVFMVLGGLALSFILVMAATNSIPAESYPTVFMSAAMAIGFIVAGYGMLRGLKWGWLLGLAMVALDIIGNIYLGNYVALAFDTFLAILLLLTAKQYGIGGKAPPTTPAPPPPTTPIATIHPLTTKRKRYVRKIRRR